MIIFFYGIFCVCIGRIDYNIFFIVILILDVKNKFLNWLLKIWLFFSVVVVWFVILIFEVKFINSRCIILYSFLKEIWNIINVVN